MAYFSYLPSDVASWLSENVDDCVFLVGFPSGSVSAPLTGCVVSAGLGSCTVTPYDEAPAVSGELLLVIHAPRSFGADSCYELTEELSLLLLGDTSPVEISEIYWDEVYYDRDSDSLVLELRASFGLSLSE